ncbi:hypothetical protein PIB30_094180 [Stylosanthes scabra]|uniref:Uncharacterized protein n=1 Tax=Stylosanthes scabra TaxID=79078 RepID=A0ABU6UWJ0_9FABA|nr:hypothetical protein [Stylosanthes scabra]
MRFDPVGFIITDGLAVGNNKSPFKSATAFPLPHSAQTPLFLLPFSLTTVPNPPSLLIFSLLGAPFAFPLPPLYSWRSRAPPIDEDALWTRIAGGRKRGRIYGMGVVPSHKYPHLFADPEDEDIASGPPDLREQVTLLNREIAQQAEAHAQSLAAVEAVCAEKVRTLESTVQTQSQEVSELRKAYSDMYSFLTQMRSNGSSSAAMPDMPPPPPPPPPPPSPARSQSPPPRPDQGTSSPQPEDNPDYV